MYQVLAVVLFLAQFTTVVELKPGAELKLLILVVMVCTHEICKNIRKLKED